MGGVVKQVAKPMVETVRSVTDAVGVTEKRQSSQAAAPAAPSQPAAETRAAAMEAAREGAEERAARRRMRRGGRALLSEARLNPEQGVSTLGQTGL